MKLVLDDLGAIHTALSLRNHPTDYVRCGALALQRAGHRSSVHTRVEHDGRPDEASIEWSAVDIALLVSIDVNRITEDGAEAVAITYAHSTEGWLVKRRLQRGEHADWLLHKQHEEWLALEVSGTTTDATRDRLRDKQRQVMQCSLPAERLAIVVGFDEPVILAGSA